MYSKLLIFQYNTVKCKHTTVFAVSSLWFYTIKEFSPKSYAYLSHWYALLEPYSRTNTLPFQKHVCLTHNKNNGYIPTEIPQYCIWLNSVVHQFLMHICEMEEVNLLSLAVKYTKATSFCPYTIWWTLFIHIHTQTINIHFVIFSPFCHFLSSPFSVSPLGSLFTHSGAEGLCVRRPHSSAGWWERVTGGHLHSGAWPSCCRGFLGDGAVWTKWEAKSGWTQWHQHHTCALHVATAELCPGENTHLCGAPPGPADRVSHTLHTKCSV